MRIITNVRKNRSHLPEVLRLIANHDEVVICSGWMKMCGLSEVLPTLDLALERGASVSVFTNKRDTETDCVAALSQRVGLFHANIPTPKYFHSKLYYGRQGDHFMAIIGSANVTAGGLWKNEELSTLIEGSVSDPLHAQLSAYLGALPALMTAHLG